MFLFTNPCLAAGTSLGKQHCSGYIFLIMNFNSEDGGSMDSEMLVFDHQTTQCNDPENNCHSSFMKTLDLHLCFLTFPVSSTLN
jgi:hypothetical protein